MRIFLMTPVGVVVTTRGRERVKSISFKLLMKNSICIYVETLMGMSNPRQDQKRIQMQTSCMCDVGDKDKCMESPFYVTSLQLTMSICSDCVGWSLSLSLSFSPSFFVVSTSELTLSIYTNNTARTRIILHEVDQENFFHNLTERC